MKKIVAFSQYIILPGMTVVYYLLFHYANNVSIVSLKDLQILILPALCISLIIYTAFFIVFMREPFRAGIAAVIFLVFFLIYGVIFDWLKVADFIQMEHLTFLPLFLTAAIYTSFAVKKINRKVIHTVNLLTPIILVGLIILNLIRIIPVEMDKYRLARASNDVSLVSDEVPETGNHYPDMYYIILDEAAAFKVIREYFDYDQVDEFVTFLEGNNFYVAEESLAGYPSTLHSMSSRLNYRDYGTDEENTIFFEAISQNKVMAELKIRGYTTIVFNELNKPFGFTAMPDIKSDYSYYPDADGPSVNRGLSGELGQLIIQQTMLSPLAGRFAIQDPAYRSHQEMVSLTRTRIANLGDIPAPRFVYVHLMLPHAPFMFDENGSLNERKNFLNYNYYLGNYIYSMDVAREMISGILSVADPSNPPVIVLQSDHGARNMLVTNSPYKVLLDGYPEEYKRAIVNVIRLPGCTDAPLTPDMDPINTFPIIFNCIFGTEIPLQ